MNARILAGGFVVLLASVARDALGQQYTVTDLGPGVATAINDFGQVVGSNVMFGLGFVYTNGTTASIPSLAGFSSSFPTSINNNGQVVGYCGNSGAGNCFIYSNGTTEVLGTPGAIGGPPNSINDNGQVAGDSYEGEYAFLYSSGTVANLGTLPGDSVSGAACVNNSGEIVGWSADGPGGVDHAFLYSSGTMTDLGTLPGGLNSNPSSINNSGQVVGEAQNSDGLWRAFLFSSGSMADLGVPAGFSQSYAESINDAGQIVGLAWGGGSGENYQHAFLYTSGTINDLDSFSVEPAGWTFYAALAINDRGQIVGDGYNPAGQEDAFLLTPTPEPSTLALLGAGGFGVLAFASRWRRAG